MYLYTQRLGVQKTVWRIHIHTHRLFFLIKHEKLTNEPIRLAPVQALYVLPLSQFSLAESQWVYQLHSPGRPHAQWKLVNKFSGIFESFGFDFLFVCFSYWPLLFLLWFSVSVVFFCLLVCGFCVCFLFILFCFYFLLRERERTRTLSWVGRQECSGRSSKREKNIIKIYCRQLFWKKYNQKPITYLAFNFYSFSFLWKVQHYDTWQISFKFKVPLQLKQRIKTEFSFLAHIFR